jgi:hypothetical protein
MSGLLVKLTVVIRENLEDTGTVAAASIAWINSIGNLGGFFRSVVCRGDQRLDR